MQSLDTKSETKSPVLLNVADLKLRVTPEEFDRLCQLNRDLQLELTKDGESIVMPPTGGETGKRNINIAADVVIWNRQTGLGEAFDSSTGYNFTAFGGRNPSPDVSWIDKSRLEGIDISVSKISKPDTMNYNRPRSSKEFINQRLTTAFLCRSIVRVLC